MKGAMKKNIDNAGQTVLIFGEDDEARLQRWPRTRESKQSIYSWHKRVGMMDVDDVKNLKALQQENVRLKKLLAEQYLEMEVTK